MNGYTKCGLLKRIPPQFFFVCVCGLVAQPCLSLCNPMDCSWPGSSVHRISQARILGWVAISSSRGSSLSKDSNGVFYIGRQILYPWATRGSVPIIHCCVSLVSSPSLSSSNSVLFPTPQMKWTLHPVLFQGLLWTYTCSFLFYYSLYLPLSLSHCLSLWLSSFSLPNSFLSPFLPPSPSPCLGKNWALWILPIWTPENAGLGCGWKRGHRFLESWRWVEWMRNSERLRLLS